MTIHKFTARWNVNPSRGSGVLYVKKESAAKVKFASNTDLMVIYDDEKGELTVKEL